MEEMNNIIEIREDVRNYILSEIKLSLSRLGITTNLKEVKTSDYGKSGRIHYHFESEPILHTPTMFRKLIVKGYCWTEEVKEDNIYYKSMKTNDVIAVSLDYSYEHFGGGRNGCSLGTMTFFVRKDIPEVFDDCLGIEFYVRKVRGLEI